ncbi:hypothetical protein JCM5350_005179 [Sporobolomyces pararoseus]
MRSTSDGNDGEALQSEVVQGDRHHRDEEGGQVIVQISWKMVDGVEEVVPNVELGEIQPIQALAATKRSRPIRRPGLRQEKAQKIQKTKKTKEEVGTGIGSIDRVEDTNDNEKHHGKKHKERRTVLTLNSLLRDIGNIMKDIIVNTTGTMTKNQVDTIITVIDGVANADSTTILIGISTVILVLGGAYWAINWINKNV